ncbi:replicative DNA helicase, partial [Candidatus Parcubacteria bacterium]|nr:replicative DNA helicase [Candidatus Parcubacteria bacterium]
MTIEAEIAVLGSCLVEQPAVNYSLAALQPDYFTDQRHQILFKAFAEMKDADINIDLVTVY